MGFDVIMNHDHHDHHDPDDPCGDHSHAMVFHSCVCTEILFPGWTTTNALELFGSCVAIFFAGLLYEGLKYYRESLHYRAMAPTGDSTVNITKTEGGSAGHCGGPATVKYTMLSSGHIVQTCFHFVQTTISYMLMLIFMTYNIWLCLALVSGMALGYFIFGWRKNSVIDSNEHCG